MNQFTFYNPVKWLFGKGKLDELASEVAPYGKRVLLVYGGGSIKRNGIYDRVMQKLHDVQAEVIEFGGVEPNPRLETVRKGIALCKQGNVDFLLAVGGGSVIDATKAIAIGAQNDADIWDIISQKAKATNGLAFGTVVTVAGAGSEMNASSVITNWETHEKQGWSSPFAYPRFSIADPDLTVSVPKEQTVFGIVDTMAHVLENYFHQTANTAVQDSYCESILREIIDIAPQLLVDSDNDTYRETLLFTSTLARNGMLNLGTKGDWATHDMEHAVSAIHDIPHAAGISILFPHWMVHVLDEATVDRFKRLSLKVFGVKATGKSDYDIALEGIEKLRSFWDSIGAPKALKEYDIEQRSIEEIAAKSVASHEELGNFKKLTKEDVKRVLELSL